MSDSISNIIIVGGGSAGWLTAGILAAEYVTQGKSGINVTLIESSDVATLGVGEGTWPSMRTTLEKMGISETEFLLECDASFKQGSKFHDWIGSKNDLYYHPFTLPIGLGQLDLAPYWQPFSSQISFTDAVCVQGRLCDKHLAPKQISTAEYSYNANYGYHLDAGKFGTFLRNHCITKLGVKHIIDHVSGLISAGNGDIAALVTKQNGRIEGDLFVDCTGFASLLLGKHYKIPFVSKKHILFNDTALAMHVPYEHADSPIASFTLSTAQKAGWIWDIGLPSRRGVGHTYSSAHISQDEAEKQLRDYVIPTLGKAAEVASIRKIPLNPGHREKFWYKNCVAIGISAGFIEPLEASALVLIELSAKMLAEQLPANRQTMDIVARRFNDKFLVRWQQIIDFLKLHYVLSHRRDSDYWKDNCAAEHIPESLQDMLSLWRYSPPSNYDITDTDALFPAASFQYILYGMGFETMALDRQKRKDCSNDAETLFNENMQRSKQLLSALPTNRELINKIKHYGLPKI
jgi:tryptophan 7-halogenase